MTHSNLNMIVRLPLLKFANYLDLVFFYTRIHYTEGAVCTILVNLLIILQQVVLTLLCHINFSSESILECSPEKLFLRIFWKTSKFNVIIEIIYYKFARKYLRTYQILSHSVLITVITTTVWKSVQIRNFCLVRISPYSVRIQGNTDQKKRLVWTIFTQCTVYK